MLLLHNYIKAYLLKIVELLQYTLIAKLGHHHNIHRFQMKDNSVAIILNTVWR
jgi:hypothetical protein